MACSSLETQWFKGSGLDLLTKQGNLVTVLPPGPRSRLLNTFRISTDPPKAYGTWRSTYGDPFTVRALNQTVVVTADVASIRRIFTADAMTFTAFPEPASKPLFGASSVVLTGGESHRAARRLLTPPLHGSRMRAYGELMAETARKHFERFRPGDRFTAQKEMLAISLEVMIRAVFGARDAPRVTQFRDAFLGMMSAAHPLFLYARFLQRTFGGRGPYARFLAHRNEVDRLIGEEIAHCRQDPGDRQDILRLLVEARDEDGQPLSDQEICEQLRSQLIAGHETTGIVASWALYWIHRDPDLLANLREELDAPSGEIDSLARLPLLDGVVKETLRIRPVVNEIFRRLGEPLELGGYEVPSGHAVGALIGLVHCDPDRYPEPDRFQADRFIGKKCSPWEFMPFGGGHRRCLGAALASYELAIVLGTMVRELDLQLMSTAPIRSVRRSITMAPEGGVPMVFGGARSSRRRALSNPSEEAHGR